MYETSSLFSTRQHYISDLFQSRTSNSLFYVSVFFFSNFFRTCPIKTDHSNSPSHYWSNNSSTSFTTHKILHGISRSMFCFRNPDEFSSSIFITIIESSTLFFEDRHYDSDLISISTCHSFSNEMGVLFLLVWILSSRITPTLHLADYIITLRYVREGLSERDIQEDKKRRTTTACEHRHDNLWPNRFNK